MGFTQGHELEVQSELFDVPYAYRDEVSTEIYEIVGKSKVTRDRLTAEEYMGRRMNSYERVAIYPCLDNHALAHVIDHYIINSRQPNYPLPACYDEALIHILAPIAVRRLLKS